MNNVVLASGAQQRDSVSRIHVSILFSNYFPIWVISESLRYSTLLTHSATPSISLHSRSKHLSWGQLLPHKVGGRREPGHGHRGRGRGALPGTRAPGTSGQLDCAASGLVSLWGWCRCGAGVVVRLECWPGTSTEGGGRRVAAAESPGL